MKTVTTLNRPVKFYTKKEFGNYLGLSDRTTIRKYYLHYLKLVGKSPDCKLTNHDLKKIDHVEI